MECIARAKTLQLNLTDTVKTVPFRGETERITKMMWPPALQQHPGASLRFLFLGETDRITKWCDHQLCNSIQVRQYGSFFLARRTESPNMWPPAMQQHPGASLRFHFMARRTESPNDVTISYATASRCVTTVPFRGETGRITTCRYKILRPVSHPPIVHSFVGTARTSGAVPPALNASLRFLFRGETDRITKWCDHQLCNSIQVRHYGSFFLGETDRITKRCDHQLCNSIQVRHYGSFTSIQMFHTHTLSHTEAFTHRPFYTQRLLHTDTFTNRHFYPQKLFTHTHTRVSFTHTLSHTKAFIHRRLHRSLSSVCRCKWNADHPNNAHAKYLYLL